MKELIHVSHPQQLTRGNFNSNEAIPLEFHQSCHIQLVQVCAKAQQRAGIRQAYGIQFRQVSPKHLLITWRWTNSSSICIKTWHFSQFLSGLNNLLLASLILKWSFQLMEMSTQLSACTIKTTCSRTDTLTSFPMISQDGTRLQLLTCLEKMVPVQCLYSMQGDV